MKTINPFQRRDEGGEERERCSIKRERNAKAAARKQLTSGTTTDHLKENQFLFLNILCSAASFDLTDLTLAWARNL